MLTKIKNIAEMSSVAESCPRGGFKIQNHPDVGGH